MAIPLRAGLRVGEGEKGGENKGSGGMEEIRGIRVSVVGGLAPPIFWFWKEGVRNDRINRMCRMKMAVEIPLCGGL